MQAAAPEVRQTLPVSNVFNEVRRRDATAAIRGFVYQVDVTLLRWLSLHEGEHLELEAGEDIDRVRNGLAAADDTLERLCESVKYRIKRLTLRSPEALATLAGFYEHALNHPTLRLTFRYLTNASIGHEAGQGSSTATAGLDLWIQVQNGTLSGKERESAAEQIRSLLRSARRPEKLNRFTWSKFTAFLKRATVLELVNYIQAVEWSVTHYNASEVRPEIEQRLVTERHINSDAEKGRAYERVFVEVFERLSTPGRKILRRTDLALALTRLQLAEVESAVLRKLQVFETFVSGKLEDISNAVDILPTRLDDIQRAVESLGEGRDGPVNDRGVSLEQIESLSSDARRPLEPALLPRLSRSVVFEKYLPAIERGYRDAERRIVVLSAPAGYGKSTVLGEIYDHLASNRQLWVGLVRCNDLPVGLSSSQFDALVGESLSGSPHPATDICESLAAQHGRGVLLIDTLDLVLTPDIVPALRRMFSQLLDVGMTVVATCRDYDYQVYLEPAREKLASVAEAIDRYTVPRFDIESKDGEKGEVVRAAELFFLDRPGALAGSDGRQFALQIVRLSADSQSLEDIIRNPLLLGMLCDLFGQTGVVPLDLTVSTLYDAYWEQRVRRGRVDSAVTVVGQERQQLCIDVASTLYGFSSEHTVDQLSDTDVPGLDRATRAHAFNDLLSEGVLRRSDRGAVSFFHQTFLEYTIARWLVSPRTVEKREALISRVLSPGPASAINWWPVLRQLLVLINEPDWERVRVRFVNASTNAFRTICQAAVARRADSVVSEFARLAISLTAVHQQCVIDVLETLPRTHAFVAWQAALLLLKEAQWQQAVNAAQLAGRLVSRWQTELRKLLVQAFVAVEEREPSNELRQSELKSWLITSLGTTSQSAPDEAILEALRKEYGRLGLNTKQTIISLHIRNGVAESDRRALLLEAVRWSLPGAFLDAVTLLRSVLASLLTSEPPSPFGTTLEEALYASLSDGWWPVQAEVVGRYLVTSSTLDRFAADLMNSKGRETRRTLTALAAAAANGAGERLSSLIRSREIGSLGSNWEKVGPLLEAIGTAAPSERSLLLAWLRPAAPGHLKKLLNVWIVLADGSLQELESIYLSIQAQPSSERPKLVSDFVQRVPQPVVTAMASRILAELDELFVAATDRKQRRNIELARIQLYKTCANESADAIDRLIERAASEAEVIALSASHALLDRASDLSSLAPSRLVPILQSRFLGVRMHGLELLDRMIERRPGPADEMLTAVSALRDEDNPTALRALCDVLTRWLRSTPKDESMTSLAVAIAARSIEIAPDAGVIRSAIKLLKALAARPTPDPRIEVENLSLRLLGCADLEKTRDGEAEMTDLLASLDRVSPTFLKRAAEEYSNGPKRVRTGQALIWAIKRVEGPESVLFDSLLSYAGIPDVVAFQVRKLRDV